MDTSKTSSNSAMHHQNLKNHANISKIAVLKENSSQEFVSSISISNISYIQTHIKKINQEQKIFNEEIFGPIDSDTTVIVIQGCVVVL